MMANTRIWKLIPEFNGYIISNYGEIKSFRYENRDIGTRINAHGYETVVFSKKNIKFYFKVHRLVLMAFDRMPNHNEQCNHKDGNKLNNHINNLEWVTSSQNHKHRCRVLYPGCNQGSKHSQSKITENDVLEIRKRINEGEKYRYIAIDFNVSESTICDIKRKKTWGHI